MDTFRVKMLIAFLAGMLCVLGVQFVRDFAAEVHFRLDHIEQYLSQREMLEQMQRQGVAPQSAPERSHKGELSQPQRWKV